MCVLGGKRHRRVGAMAEARFAQRLELLPHAELARLAAKAMMDSPRVARQEAGQQLAVLAPVPEWVTDVLLSADIVLSLIHI